MEYSSNPDKITRDYFDSLLLETRYLDSGDLWKELISMNCPMPAWIR